MSDSDAYDLQPDPLPAATRLSADDPVLGGAAQQPTLPRGRRPPECPNCGYCTIGLPSSICPECGQRISWYRVNQQDARRVFWQDRTLLVVGALLYLGGLGGVFWRIGNIAGWFICCTPLLCITAIPLLWRIFDDHLPAFLLACGLLAAAYCAIVWSLT